MIGSPKPFAPSMATSRTEPSSLIHSWRIDLCRMRAHGDRGDITSLLASTAAAVWLRVCASIPTMTTCVSSSLRSRWPRTILPSSRHAAMRSLGDLAASRGDLPKQGQSHEGSTERFRATLGPSATMGHRPLNHSAPASSRTRRKVPTTSLRRASSRLTRSSGLVDQIFVQCSRGQARLGEHVILRAKQDLGRLRERRGQALGHGPQLGVGRGLVGLGEDRPDEGCNHPTGVPRDVGQQRSSARQAIAAG